MSLTFQVALEATRRRHHRGGWVAKWVVEWVNGRWAVGGGWGIKIHVRGFQLIVWHCRVFMIARKALWSSGFWALVSA